MTDLGRPLRGNHATRATPGAATASPPFGECQAQEELLLEIIAHLGAARMRIISTDDQIIAEHIRAAHDLACVLRRTGL